MQHTSANLITSIIKKIAGTADKVELLKVIYELVMPLFEIESATIVIINQAENYHYDLMMMCPDLKINDRNKKQSDGIPGYKMKHKGTMIESHFNELKSSIRPLVFDYINCYERWLDPHSKYYLDEGYLESYAALFQVGNEPFGILYINSKQRGRLIKNDAGQFQQVADIIAIALSNIFTREEILEREKEKRIQLEILETLNQSNSWTDKFMSVAQKFDEYIGCDLFSYSIRLHDGKRIGKGFMKHSNTGIFKAKSLDEYLNDMNVTEKEYITLYTQSMGLFTGSRYLVGAELKDVACEFELLKKSMEAYNSRSMVFTEKEFPKGTILFTLNSKNDHQYNSDSLQFLASTAQQMTLSIMNILDNEEVVEKEKQKTLAIKINNAVLTNENFRDVMKEISSSIGITVGCDICYIRIMSDQIDPKPFHFFCERTDSRYIVKAVDEKVSESGISAAQASKNAALFLTTIKKPTILSGVELELLTPKFEYLQIFTGKIGIRSFIFLPLQLKYNCTAYLIIGSKMAYSYIENDLELISNVKAQLSLALDNRLAFYQIQRLKETLENENLYLQETINDNYNFNEIIGSSSLLQKVFGQASMVAGTDTTVLITGETGTGKELLARAIHNHSKRKGQIMVKVNCACLPAPLIESELFGHEKGAFTGAHDKRIGKFELANGGTIFLDEIGELPLELQSKLLRVIQEREFERIGGRSVLKTDIRIIAATNKDLELESKEKRFRSDLYYRLNVFPIHMPALKERKEDIPLLALHFAKKFGQKMGKKITAVTSDALQQMIHYEWPGNIRELEHVVEHSVISSKSNRLSLAKPLLTNKFSSVKSLNEFKIKTLNDNEKEHILSVLRYCNGRIRGSGGAAQLLDIHPNTLDSRMAKLGIRKEHVLSN